MPVDSSPPATPNSPRENSTNSWRARLDRPSTFRWFALAEFVATIVITLTGGLVRLTGSGLGCPDWPTCYRHHLTGALGVHGVIEYGNRMVTGALVVLSVWCVVAALLRTPRRRDLVVLSGALGLGIVANAALGAIVVATKLNPWLVSVHFVLSLAMVILGATLYHRSKYLYGDDHVALVRDSRFRTVARLTWVPFIAVVIAGTLASGSGPHSGGSHGQLVARRLPIAFSAATWVHSVAAMVFVSFVLGLLVAIWRTSAPLPLQLGVRRLAIIGLVQAAIGFTQYLTHVPVVLVELHLAGATSLAIGVTQFTLRQTSRERVPGTKRAT